jgi:hypothetical protein
VAYLVETLGYKPESRGYDCRSGHWIDFRPHYSPGFDSPCNRNEYQEYLLGGIGSWCVEVTNSPLSYVDCLEILEHQTPVTLGVRPGLYMDCFTCLLKSKTLWNLYICGRKWAKLSKGFTSMKGVPVTTSFVTSWRIVYFCHPRLLLRINHPEWL